MWLLFLLLYILLSLLIHFVPYFSCSAEDHPYAKVVRDDSEDPETDTDNYDDPKAIAKDKK